MTAGNVTIGAPENSEMMPLKPAAGRARKGTSQAEMCFSQSPGRAKDSTRAPSGKKACSMRSIGMQLCTEAGEVNERRKYKKVARIING
jgi:hypothetical protein